MLDSGRRFSPVAVVEDLLDVMGAAKMSVLHWHLSDYCRWSVESEAFPALTQNLTGLDAGAYSKSDVAGVVAYAKDRGIRVVPEFDFPGHTYGMRSLEGEGLLTFCKGGDWTLAGDNATLRVLKTLVSEMAALFDDDVFHLGMDEVSEPAPCTPAATQALETELLAHVRSLGKTPMGWDPVAAVASPGSAVVNSWKSNAGAAAFASEGYDVVDAANALWYFTHPAGWDAEATCRPAGCAGPDGWTTAWHRPGGASNSSKVLGGEFALWTDDYAYPGECGAHGTMVPANASCMMARSLDDAFRASLSGLAWPRGLVAAAAFYNFDASLDAASANFTSSVYAFNDQLAARGFRVCASGAVCSYVSQDDVLYPGIDDVEGYNCSAQITGT